MPPRPSPSTSPPSNPPRSRADVRDFAIETARLAHDLKCEDVRLLDVRGLSHVCDYVLIATGTSEKQMKSVAEDMAELGDEMNHAAFRSNRDTGATWIVIDFIELVAHLFEPSHRSYYELEKLWSDAPEVAWQRPRSATTVGDEPANRINRKSEQ